MTDSRTVADDFIDSMKWSEDTPEIVRSAVIANVRGFWAWMHSESMEGCQAGVDEALEAKFRQGVTIRGVPVWVCADEFTEDKSTGTPWGPENVWAIRRDDATQFVLTCEEEMHWAEVAAESVSPYADDPGF